VKALLIAVLGGLAALLFGLGVGFWWGHSSASSACTLHATTQALAQTRETVKTNTATQSVSDAVATESAERHDQVVTRFVPIEKEVIRYVQTPAAATACLDADGLRIWSAANRGEFDAAGSPGAGHAAVSGSSGAGERESGGSAGEPRRDGEGLPGVQSAAISVGQARPRDQAGAR
jgi:hypothetical protein